MQRGFAAGSAPWGPTAATPAGRRRLDAPATGQEHVEPCGGLARCALLLRAPAPPDQPAMCLCHSGRVLAEGHPRAADLWHQALPAEKATHSWSLARSRAWLAPPAHAPPTATLTGAWRRRRRGGRAAAQCDKGVPTAPQLTGGHAWLQPARPGWLQLVRPLHLAQPPSGSQLRSRLGEPPRAAKPPVAGGCRRRLPAGADPASACKPGQTRPKPPRQLWWPSGVRGRGGGSVPSPGCPQAALAVALWRRPHSKPRRSAAAQSSSSWDGATTRKSAVRFLCKSEADWDAEDRVAASTPCCSLELQSGGTVGAYQPPGTPGSAFGEPR